MNVGIFTYLDDRDSSSRASGYSLRPLLEAAGHRASVLAPPWAEVQWYAGAQGRNRLLGRALQLAYWGLLVPAARVTQLWRVRGCDVVVVQRGLLNRRAPVVLEHVLRHIVPEVVYTFDDALYLAPVEQRQLVRRLRLADRVFVGNPKLAAFARRYVAQVYEVPQPVPIAQAGSRKEGTGSPVVIGWTGTRHRFDDLLLAMPALEDLATAEDIVLRLASEHTFTYRPRTLKIEQVRWSTDGEAAFLAELDIAIAPYRDNEYNNASETYKVKLAMGAGLPVVASPVLNVRKVITHGTTGFLARTDAEWSEYLAALIRDENLRRTMGERARQVTAVRFSAQALAPHYLRAILGAPDALGATVKPTGSLNTPGGA